MNKIKEITLLMNSQIGNVFSSAQLFIDIEGKSVFNESFGDANRDTIFDIASLTKPIVTVTIIMKLYENKKIALNDKVSTFLSSAKDKWIGGVSIFNLLSHSSGLPSWRDYAKKILEQHPKKKFDNEFIKATIFEWIINEKREYKTGEKSLYSDLGFILLGYIIEKIEKKGLLEIFKDYVSNPLGLNDTFFIKEEKESTNIADTGWCNLRKKILKGEVNDCNAWILGGVAGHAGIFSKAEDVRKWARCLLDCYKGKNDYLNKKTIEVFLSHKFSPSSSTWSLGFDTPSRENSSAGKYFSSKSFGHLGWTGCSFWINIEKDLVVVLLTNRTAISERNENIKKFRPILHNLIVETFFK